ncbi:hypothetical protein J605_0732 [Acinetobacter baumannii 1412924]|uniref:hypothetical protein n=1 Tax=Acinetobacter baumannii TaxID=470 RepID=UPI0004484343|nr:hypothetical protein [Acinetobacter baumannii]EXH50670.1 hypothetical protein J605_0732 [Acinetobacter baumannii 1412924]
MTDLNKLRSEFEAQHSDKVFKIVKFDEATNAYCLHAHLPLTEINLSALAEINYGWDLWQKAKAQAVPEHIVTLQRNDEVFKFDLLDLLRRSLKSSKVVKTRENWSHVSKMVGLGSTTATLLCKEMNVDPDGTVFVASESGAEQ